MWREVARQDDGGVYELAALADLLGRIRRERSRPNHVLAHRVGAGSNDFDPRIPALQRRTQPPHQGRRKARALLRNRSGSCRERSVARRGSAGGTGPSAAVALSAKADATPTTSRYPEAISHATDSMATTA